MTTVEGHLSSSPGDDAEEEAPSAVVSHRPEQDPEQVRAYWTDKRRRAARPRPMTLQGDRKKDDGESTDQSADDGTAPGEATNTSD